jgi:hypothetical protein
LARRFGGHRRQDSDRYKDKLIARLAKLGYIVTVEPAQTA